MKQSYPAGMVAAAFKVPLTFEQYNQGRLLVSDMAHVCMPSEKLLCGKCRKEIDFGSGQNSSSSRGQECCGITYIRRVHSYVIEAVLNHPSENEK